MSNDMSNVMSIIMVNVTSKFMSNVAQKVNRQQMDKEHTGESHRVHELNVTSLYYYWFQARKVCLTH